MIKYTKQLHTYDCVPAAIANSWKWAGKPFSYRQEKNNIFRLTRCTRGRGRKGGVDWSWAGSGIVRAGKGLFSVVTLPNPYLGELESHLLDEGAVILSYIFYLKSGRLARHAVFIPGISPDRKSFDVVVNGKIVIVPRVVLNKFYLRYRREHDPTLAYLLSKTTND